MNAPGRESAPASRAGTVPRLGVHVMTEFVFCPWAGRIAYEAGGEDDGQDREVPRLGYLPEYEPVLIRGAIRQRLAAIRSFLTWAPWVIGTALLLGLLFGWWLTALLALAAVWPLRRFVRQIHECRLLYRRLRAYERAVPQAPSPDLDVPQRIDWRSMLRAGFEPVKLHEALQDRDLRLSGRPRYVLRHGAVLIPVFVTRSKDPRPRRQHFARIAAYCHLIETSQRARSPYGLLLFAGTYEGWALPKNAASLAAFRDGVAEARATIASREEPPVAAPRCTGCHWGRPVVVKPGERQTKVGNLLLPVRSKPGKDNRAYHSVCGDRFGWLPPHALATELRLR